MPGILNITRFLSERINKIFQRAFYAFLFFSLILFSFPVPGQRTKIDSLKQAVHTLRDKDRIDGLNMLSLAYSYLNADTAKFYAQKAFEEASDIGYLDGKAMSLNNDARIAGHAFQDFQLQKKISLQILQSYKDCKNEKIIPEAYMNLALAFFCQNYFDSSANACIEVIRLSKKAGDRKMEGEALSVLGSINFETGNYEKSFEYFNESLGVFKAINDTYNTAILLIKIGDFYRLAGDHKSALNFYFQSLEYPKGPSLLWHPLVDLGDTYYSSGQNDSISFEQEKYIQTIKSMTLKSNYVSYPNIRMAEMYIASEQYDKALVLLAQELQDAKRKNDGNLQMRILLDIARSYDGKKNYTKALQYTKLLLSNSINKKARQYTRDAYKLMYMIYDRLRQTDKAYFYYHKYIDMKDSVAFDEFSKKLEIYTATKENEKKQSEIELLNNEKLINKQQLHLTEQQLKSESFQKNIFIVSIVFLTLLGFVIFRIIALKQRNTAHQNEIVKQELSMQKLESEKVKSELLQEGTELQMQALRSQMNPHFIFNSLNSINRFILQSNKTEASEYLTKFSQLIRLILQNSMEKLITLENELEALQLYLELEALRFDDHFEYKININDSLDASMIKVPPLIIQPFAENAIWHGLMHKEEKGQLQIDLFQWEDFLCCKITDNGIGRKRSAELRGKSTNYHHSTGMRITKDRIAMLGKKKESETFFNINDLLFPDGSPAGTEVNLKIPIQYD